MPLLEVRNIHFRYGNRKVLKDITLTAKAGEIIGIIGPNGSGKTTLLRIMDGLLKPVAGDVYINGANIKALKRSDLAKLVALVAQESHLIFPFTVEEIVLMGRSPHLRRFRFETPLDYDIVHEAMRMTDTLDLAARRFQELSGGERQRVRIARALAQEPQIMLLDEFTTFLDMHHQIGLFDLMKTLNATRNLTLVIATHDINMIAQYADRIIMLREGEAHCVGTPESVITHDNILTVYRTEVMIDHNPLTGSPRLTKTSRLGKS